MEVVYEMYINITSLAQCLYCSFTHSRLHDFQGKLQEGLFILRIIGYSFAQPILIKSFSFLFMAILCIKVSYSNITLSRHNYFGRKLCSSEQQFELNITVKQRYIKQQSRFLYGKSPVFGYLLLQKLLILLLAIRVLLH